MAESLDEILFDIFYLPQNQLRKEQKELCKLTSVKKNQRRGDT